MTPPSPALALPHGARCRWAAVVPLLIAVVCGARTDAARPGSVATATSTDEAQIRSAIVKIYAVRHRPDFYNPWRMLNTTTTTGSGCIIAGRRVLTNAHVVADHKFIQVRRYGHAKRHRAKLLWVSHEADLALLTVEDAEFFAEATPLELGPLPDVQQETMVYGFPLGGDSLSITKGILSRIEHQVYSHSSHYFIAGQIDAAINPGNSGGPVIVDGKVVGVVMQTHNRSSAENIGYMVPTPIVRHFLQDVEDGRYDGFPDLGVMTQHMQNPHLKRKHGVPEDRTGILVRHVMIDSVAEGKVRKGDVLLAIDEHVIADDGSVEFRTSERTDYSYYVDLCQIDDEVSVKLLRGTDVKEITIKLTSTGHESLLVKPERYDTLPRYFIYGGFVFSPLTKNVIMRWGNNWNNAAPKELVQALSNWATADRRELVVILQTLASDLNVGYHNLGCRIVHEIDGKTFRNFDEAYKLVATSGEPFTTFRIDKQFEIAVQREEALAKHAELLDRYRIGRDRSADLTQLEVGLPHPSPVAPAGPLRSPPVGP